jgi:hypothetical protein
MNQLSMLTPALLLVGSGLTSAGAQTHNYVTDAAPRSVFLPCPDDLPSFTYCNPVQCKRQRDDWHADFPNWSHVTNTAKPPRPIYLVICMESSYWSLPPIYKIITLNPGESWWGLIFPPSGHWSWINTWVIDAEGPYLDGYELSHNTSNMRDDRTIEPETFGTVQAQFVEGIETLNSSAQMFPTGWTPWQVDRKFEAIPNGMIVSENWTGNGDPLVDRCVTMKLEYNATGFVQTVEIDVGKNGTIDSRSVMSFDEPNASTDNLVLTRYDGAGVKQAEYKAQGVNVGTTHTWSVLSDLDGDGIADEGQKKFSSYFGLSSISSNAMDDNGDGIPERTENSIVECAGYRQSNQNTVIVGSAGQILENISIQLQPTLNGYTLNTLHDMNGDGVFDVRETQISNVAPFGQGLDDDIFGIDMLNDGTYENISRSMTLKGNQGSQYNEINGLDIGLDGVVDGITVRAEQLSGTP